MALDPSPSNLAAPRLNPWALLSHAGVILMEASWLTLIFRALGPETASGSNIVTFSFLGLSLLLATLLERALFQWEILPTVRRIAMLLLYAASTFAGLKILLGGETSPAIDPFATTLKGIGQLTRLLPGELLLALTMVWVLWRGTTLARQGAGSFAVMRHFKLGVGMFLVFSVLALAVQRDLPGLGMFLLFTFATLMAMSAARVAVLGKFRGGRRNPFTRAWLASITTAVATTVGAGFSLAMLATGRFLAVYQQLLALIFGGIVTLVLSPFLLLIGLLANANIQPFPAPPPEPVLPPWEQDSGFVPNFTDRITDQVELLPPSFRPLVYWGAVLLLAAALLLIIWRFSIVSRRRRAAGGVEYVIKRGDLLEHIRQRARERNQARQANASARAGLRQGQRLLAAAKIRRIYARLMALGIQIDTPRPASYTPLEYLSPIQHALPAARADLAVITDAYLKVRYGELPETRAEVHAVEQAWEHVQELGAARKRIVQAQKRAQEREQKRKERQM